MDDGSQKKLDELSAVVKKYLEEIRKADQKHAEILQEQLTGIISSMVTDLMNAGVPVSTIQELLHKSTDVIPNSYARDVDGDVLEYADIEELRNAEVLTVISLVDTDDILNVGNGDTDADDFIDGIIENRAAVFRGTFELIGHILSECGKFPEFDIVTVEGNMVTDGSGEALIPEKFDITYDEEQFFITGDPVIYKTGTEVADALHLMSQIERETFEKKFDIKKLIRAGAFPSNEPRVIKRMRKEILEDAWNDFLVLRNIYAGAIHTGKTVVVTHLCSEE